MSTPLFKKISQACTYLAASCFMLGAAPGAGAQGAYPDRAITFVVPYSAGGLPDTVARLVAQELGQKLGQTVVVENKPGANGVIAANVIKTNRADGYTFLVTDGSMISINPHIYKNLSYSPLKDFVPVSLIATSPLFLAVNKSLKVSTLKEFIDLIKSKPGFYSYGSSGVGSSHQLSMEALKSALGLQITHVPYKGSGQSVPALVGDQVQAAFAALPSLTGFVDKGDINILASNSLTRSALAKDVPTISEVIPGYNFAVSIGILARTGTPDQAIQKISSAVAEVTKIPAFRQRLATLGIEAVGGDAKTYGANTKEESDRYVKAIESAHISVN